MIFLKRHIIGKGDKPQIVREQHCFGCRSILAYEITDKMGFGGEYYVVKAAYEVKGEVELVYEKKRWFGNWIKCPVCGREGNLPIDKPYNWEVMQNKEVSNAN